MEYQRVNESPSPSIFGRSGPIGENLRLSISTGNSGNRYEGQSRDAGWLQSHSNLR